LIPYGRQDISETDIQTVVDVLRSDFLTQGPTVPLFEKKINTYCNSKYTVATNSATSALHIACLSLGLGLGDRLWTSPNTFVASANCGLYCGAEVDFVDIDSNTYNMSIEALEEKLEVAEKENKLPKIIIPVHFAGQSCDMKSVHRLSIKYGFKVIEDASHAIGGRYLGEMIGGCHYSDITIFSFHPVKIITTGEGGVATTNDPELAEHMRRLRTHGITRDKELMVGEVDGDWSYQQIELGYNYRMTDLQAALGVSQLDRINKFIKRRTEIRNVYDQMLSSLPIIKPWQDSDTESSFHLYPIQINVENDNLNRKIVFNKLRESGIGVNIHYIPVHTQPFYRKLGFKKGDFPAAEKYYKNTISLPMYPTLTNIQQGKVVSELSKALAH
jgi:UDP-4-amino-4,6-dideoxy-N-acetyl-beta-L-altrosamine transaminase